MKAIRWGLTEVVQTVLDAKPSLHLQNKVKCKYISISI